MKAAGLSGSGVTMLNEGETLQAGVQTRRCNGIRHTDGHRQAGTMVKSR